MNKSGDLNRREFLKLSMASGAALLVSKVWSVSDNLGKLEITNQIDFEDSYQRDLYLKLDTSGKLTVIIKMVEMGQGISTGLAMWAAEELDQPWENVKIELARGDQKYGEQRTAGSASMRIAHSEYREASAYLRWVLVLLAADEWQVDPNNCTTYAGVVIHPDGVQQLTYGELVVFALDEVRMSRLDLPEEVPVKSSESLTLVGTPVDLVHLDEIVTGQTIYGSDVRLPGMLYAALEQPPVEGAVLISYDDSAARNVPGVLDIVPTSYGLAVLAENTWAAFSGKDSLTINWSDGYFGSVFTNLLEREMVARASALLSHTPNILESVYQMSYLAHLTMEPMNCTADVQEDSCEIWAPCQFPQQAREAAALESGLPIDTVTANIPFLGGGFGRRIETDFVRQSVAISKLVATPVQLVWTRKDDIQHDYYHPISTYVARADLNNPQMPELQYIPIPENLWSKPVGAWRAAGNLTPAFVQQCFVDELAAALNKDPVTLRLEIEDPKMHPVIELAAEKAGWGETLPEGWGRGMACYNTNDTPAALVVELSVTDTGDVQVHRVVCAVSPGLVVNPDLVKAQIEGGIIFGLSAALKGKITIDAGQIEQTNFHDHPIMRFDESPEIEVYPISTGSFPFGVGEMAVSPILPATLNAIFAATGKRIRRIPVISSDLRQKQITKINFGPSFG